jgi:hypothetical protein
LDTAKDLVRYSSDFEGKNPWDLVLVISKWMLGHHRITFERLPINDSFYWPCASNPRQRFRKIGAKAAVNIGNKTVQQFTGNLYRSVVEFIPND